MIAGTCSNELAELRDREYNRELISTLFRLQPSHRTQKEFARHTGYSAVTINTYLRNRGKGNPEIALELADWFDIPVDALFKDSDWQVSIVFNGEKRDILVS